MAFVRRPGRPFYCCLTLTCVYHRGRFVVAQYCHGDTTQHSSVLGTQGGEDQGMEILKFLWEPGNIERLREGLQHIATLTKEGRQQLANSIYHDEYHHEYATPIVKMHRMHNHWPSLSRGTGAGILKLIARATAEKHTYVPIWLWPDANEDYMWAYVVDLDQNTFEVFEGTETKQEASTTRFNDVGGDDATVPALLKSFSFSQLPATKKEFVRTLGAAMKEKGNKRGFLRFYGDAADSDEEEEDDKLLEEGGKCQ
jgi:hypothetical protein